MTRTHAQSTPARGIGVVAVLALCLAAFSTPPAQSATGHPPEVRAAAPSLQPAQSGATHSNSKRQAARTTATTAALAAPAQATTLCGSVSIAPGSTPANGYLPLSLFGVPPIAGIGDDTVTAFDVPDFLYAGSHHTKLQVFSNGYVQVGDSATNSIINQSLPDPSDPNNLLAALWTDLNPGAAGAMRVGTLTDGSDTWIVVDWDGVPEFSNAANTHSVEVWIGVSGDANPGQDISYAYGANTGNGDSGFLTVGAENADGTSGGQTYYNGTGTLPTNGTQLRVSFDGAPNASFSATPPSGTAPLHVDFDASASSDDETLTSYSWDFGDSTTGTGVTTSHDYAAGVYTATLTVTDSDNKTCSTTTTISSEGGFSVNNVSRNENAGTATFAVTRPGGPAASVDVSALAGTAKTPADFTAAPATLSFAAGVTSKNYVVTIKQDPTDEFDENYQVKLTNPVHASILDNAGVGTIVDEDAAPRLAVNDANLTEGNSGTKNLTFKVTLNRASGKTVKVTLHTADGSARAPSDYVSKTVTLAFSPGQTLKAVPIAVRGDTVREPNETFFVLLDSPAYANFNDPNGSGGIINND